MHLCSVLCWLLLLQLGSFEMAQGDAASTKPITCREQLTLVSPSTSIEWIDDATPSNSCTVSVCQADYHNCTADTQNKEDLVLVFSDEFNSPRNLLPGHDRKWQAMDLHYREIGHMENYKPDAVKVEDGSLVITTARARNTAPFSGVDGDSMVTTDYKSGMVQSWNKFCFTGGYLEARVQLPGDHLHGGLRPTIWTLGNLGRAGYLRSLAGLWPYSYNTCDAAALGEITWSRQPGQRINACNSSMGRGAPQIDMFEAGVRKGNPPAVRTTLHMAPMLPPETTWVGLDNGTYVPGRQHPTFKSKWPDPGFYVLDYNTSSRAGTEYQDMMTAHHELNESYWSEFHKYAVDWQIPEYVRFYIDDVLVYEINQLGLAAQANQFNQSTGPRLIPFEPSSIIINTAVGDWDYWSPNDVALPLPAEMKVDYIRLYQRKTAISIGCDPPGMETTPWISCHKDDYYFKEYGERMKVPPCGVESEVEQRSVLTLSTSIASAVALVLLLWLCASRANAMALCGIKVPVCTPTIVTQTPKLHSHYTPRLFTKALKQASVSRPKPSAASSLRTAGTRRRPAVSSQQQHDRQKSVTHRGWNVMVPIKE